MRLPIRPILRSIHASPITLPRHHKSFPKTNPVTLTQIRAYGERAPIATKEDDIRLEKKSIAEEFELKQSLDPLLLENGGKWELASDGMRIRRAFTFRYFKDAWNFMKTVAQKSAHERHHPEWANSCNQVFIQWTTHDAGGLSRADTLMAEFCDIAAAKYKEWPTSSQYTKRDDAANLTRKSEELLNLAKQQFSAKQTSTPIPIPGSQK